MSFVLDWKLILNQDLKKTQDRAKTKQSKTEQHRTEQKQKQKQKQKQTKTTDNIQQE
jgi:hypothetical protein